MVVEFKTIGIIHTPFKGPKGTPIQPRAGKGIKGIIEVYPEYKAGLCDLADFSHIVLIYYLHLIKGFNLKVVPFMDNKERGVFATRAPRRPNAIGLSVVKLEKIAGNKLYICNLDIVDGTPLLDIKPYVPAFDEPEEIKIGWLRKRIQELPHKRDDGRFNK